MTDKKGSLLIAHACLILCHLRIVTSVTGGALWLDIAAIVLWSIALILDVRRLLDD